MAGVENIEINTAVGQEEHQQFPVAYHPIPRCVIKEETKSDEDERFETIQHLKAYPPLPHGEIKEESEIEEDRDEFIFNGEQLMTQQGRNRDQSNQEHAAESGSTVWESTEEEGCEYDEDNERSEHSSLEGLDESGNSLSVDSADENCLPSPKAGPSKESTRQVQKASHRKERENCSYHTSPKKRRFKCSKCEQSYKHKSSLTFHLKYGCGISPRPSFSCTQCGDQFTIKCNLQRHLINVHKIDRKHLDQYGAGPEKRHERPFKCTKCGSLFKRKRSHDHHVKFECGVSFNCTLCKQNYSTKSSLRKHLLNVHNIARRQVDQFGAGYKVRPIQSYKCDRCGRTYSRKDSLVRHLTVECGVEASFPCPQCDRRCKHKSSLKLHLIENHKVGPSQLEAFGLGPVVRPENQFKCDRCGASYKRKNDMKRHLVNKCEK